MLAAPRATASPACCASDPRSPRRASAWRILPRPRPGGYAGAPQIVAVHGERAEVDRIAQARSPASAGTAAAPRSATGRGRFAARSAAHTADASRMNEPTCEPPNRRDPTADARVIRRTRARDCGSDRRAVSLATPRRASPTALDLVLRRCAADEDRLRPLRAERRQAAPAKRIARRAGRALEPGIAPEVGNGRALPPAAAASAGISAANAPVVCQMRQRVARAAHLLHRLVELLLHALRRQPPEMRRARLDRATRRRRRSRTRTARRSELRAARAADPRACARPDRPRRARSCASRSRCPSNGSRISSSRGEYAMALIVKSRRARSSSSDAPNSTSACRPSVFTSRRKVVTSCIVPSRSSTPTVPNSMPTGIVRRAPNSSTHLGRRGRRRQVPVEMRVRRAARRGWLRQRTTPRTRLLRGVRDLENGRRRVKASHWGDGARGEERWRIARPVSAVKMAGTSTSAAIRSIFVSLEDILRSRIVALERVGSDPRRVASRRAVQARRSQPVSRARVRPVAAASGCDGSSAPLDQGPPAPHAHAGGRAAPADRAHRCSRALRVLGFRRRRSTCTRRPKRTSTNSSGIAAGAPSRKAGPIVSASPIRCAPPTSTTGAASSAGKPVHVARPHALTRRSSSSRISGDADIPLRAPASRRSAPAAGGAHRRRSPRAPPAVDRRPDSRTCDRRVRAARAT